MGLTISALTTSIAAAACSTDAIGTHRVLEVDTSKYREILGHEKWFGLKEKEVILTFDDGPIAGKTPRILKTLREECVKATFFYVGCMAKVYPKLVRQVVREGHTLAHHTHAHNRLPNYSSHNASRLIDKGVSTLQKIAYDDDSIAPRIPFFRYPYLARSNRTDGLLAQKGMVAFGANIDSLDWKKSAPWRVHDRIMRKLRREKKGIILMHDIQGRTASMLPRLLRTLKDEGYKIVHMVPKGMAPDQPPQSEPLLVAKRESEEKAVKLAKVSQQSKPETETTAKIEPRQSVAKTVKAAKVSKSATPTRAKTTMELVEQAEQKLFGTSRPTTTPPKAESQRLAKVNSSTQRTGVQLAVSTPSSIATIHASQLSSLSKRGVNTSKRKETAAKTVETKRQRARPAGKPSLLVLAGDRRKSPRNRKANVIRGNWKLRRSQWILN